MKLRRMRMLGNWMLVSLLTMSAAGVATATTPKIKHAIIGSVETVNKAAKTVGIKTADGTVETIRWTSKTSVHGLSNGAKAADVVGRAGSHIVIHYSVKGSTKTAHAVEYLGSETPKVAEGTLKIAGKGAKTVVVKTTDGAEESFDLAVRSVVETSHGVEDAVKFTTNETTDGAKVSVHYVEKGGRKIAHFITHLNSPIADRE